MQVRETFATAIQKRIEPVVKVVDRNPATLLNEIGSLVVTPQWERHLLRILDSYADAASRDDEQGVGLWVSGFFGSGKSLLVKVLGALLEDRELAGQRAHELFLGRLPADSVDRATINRLLTVIKRGITTTVVGGNLHALQASRDDPLALIAFKLFADGREFTKYWPLAWAVEYQIDERGLTPDFRQRVEDASGERWAEVAQDAEIYLEHLYAAAAAVLPSHFAGGAVAVERAVDLVMKNGLTPQSLIERLRRWCAARDGGGRRHKLLMQLDELGQWIGGGNQGERAQQVQALVETAATAGGGRIWLAVTAHGDVQALQSNLLQEDYAKINQRFANKCKLTNEDISQVVEQRLLQKTQAARQALEDRFRARSGDLADLGTVRGKREYPVPNDHRFALFYPYMPWTVAVIPDVVKGIAQAAGREEALTGSNRTMIGVVQGGILETPGLLEAPVGRLLSLADLYDQLASDAPIETKTDLNRIRESVLGATDFTPRVARALYLLGEVKYLHTTVEQIVRALVDALDANLATLQAKVTVELDRLVEAGFAKKVGEQYFFLSTQQRGFQDSVRTRQQELESKTYDLGQALKEFDGDDALRFDKVALEGKELALRLEIDGRVARNPTAHVTLRVLSPFQRALEPAIEDDAVLKQRSNDDPQLILLRLGQVARLRSTLALALATDQVSNEVRGSATSSDHEKEVALQARQEDLASHREEVRRLLAQAVRGALLFYRGTGYQPLGGDGAAGAIRATLGEILPQIYARLADLPQRITNEEAAVKAALQGNTTNADLQNLHVFRADGSLNEAHALVSTLRSKLPIDDQYQPYVQAEQLRSEIERPPYGWDPNAAKVGLALLLRASGCRLIEGGRTLSDPTDPEVVQLITKEARFRGLRVQGVRSELGVKELQEIRGYIEALFGVKPALVAATLNGVLGDKLAELARQAQAIQGWAHTARCPLPQVFEAGVVLVGDLLNNASPNARLPRFREQAPVLLQFNETLGQLEEFRRSQGAEFANLRDFFQSMVYADTNLPPVQLFIKDWRTLTEERTITERARWNELMQSYHAAQAAIRSQIATYRTDAERQLAEIEANLERRVRDTGAPPAEVAGIVHDLHGVFELVREGLAKPGLDLSEAKKMLTRLANGELTVSDRIRELRTRYHVEPTPTGGTLRWSEIAQRRQISSVQEVDELLVHLRAELIEALEQHKTVTLE